MPFRGIKPKIAVTLNICGKVAEVGDPELELTSEVGDLGIPLRLFFAMRTANADNIAVKR